MEKSKRIFIVEDSLDFQLLLQTIFTEDGYIVDYAMNGEEALPACVLPLSFRA